jgi:hypothetical protein
VNGTNEHCHEDKSHDVVIEIPTTATSLSLSFLRALPQAHGVTHIQERIEILTTPLMVMGSAGGIATLSMFVEDGREEINQTDFREQREESAKGGRRDARGREQNTEPRVRSGEDLKSALPVRRGTEHDRDS